jgi:hypothetical protein
MKNFPSHKSVKYLFVFSLSFFVGQILVSMRNTVPDFLSIIVGSNLQISGYLFLYLAVRGLMGIDSKWYHRYFIPIIVVLMGFLFFTYVIYDTQIRIIIFCLFCALYSIIIAWVFWDYSSSRFTILNKSTAGLFFILAIGLIVSAIKISIAQIPANFLRTNETILALLYIYWIIITMWLAVVFTLQISLSYSNNLDNKSSKN